MVLGGRSNETAPGKQEAKNRLQDKRIDEQTKAKLGEQHRQRIPAIRQTELLLFANPKTGRCQIKRGHQPHSRPFFSIPIVDVFQLVDSPHDPRARSTSLAV